MHEFLHELHERKAKCLNNSKIKEIQGSQLEPINQTLKEAECKLKRYNIYFILKTLDGDGDDSKWKEIQLDCCVLFSEVKLLAQ